MKRFLGWLDRRWYLFLAGGCIGAELLVFLIFRENSYFTVQDNLDLFVAHFQVLSHSNSWFAHGATVPMLGGISRDSLSSEWNLYNILYTFMPVFWAYLTGYFLKILIGTGSFVLLAKDVYQKAYPRYRGIAWAAGLCYGLLPLSRHMESRLHRFRSQCLFYGGSIGKRENGGMHCFLSTRFYRIFPISDFFCWRIWCVRL